MEFFNSLLHSLAALAVGLIMWSATLAGVVSNTVVINKQPPFISIQKNATSSASNAGSGAVLKGAVDSPTIPPATPLSQTPAVSITAPSVFITDDIISQTNTQARSSLVNILCSFRTTNTYSYISGSGLMIDPRGVILTNAHVAQFFLLQNYPTPGSTSCTIRSGSPAAPAYTATLLYIPSAWIAGNASQILSSQATGTGERDYAFLYITGSAQFAPAPPSAFPALAISLDIPKQTDPVLLVGYPAGFLDATGVQRNLYVSSSVSTVQQLYTFNDPHEVDLVSLGGTVISQSGSSGGAVVNLANDKLIGLISTESEGTTTASRDLRAITLFYINKNLQADDKGGIAGLLSGDLAKTSQNFNTTVAPGLTAQLVAAIEKK